MSGWPSMIRWKLEVFNQDYGGACFKSPANCFPPDSRYQDEYRIFRGFKKITLALPVYPHETTRLSPLPSRLSPREQGIKFRASGNCNCLSGKLRPGKKISSSSVRDGDHSITRKSYDLRSKWAIKICAAFDSPPELVIERAFGDGRIVQCRSWLYLFELHAGAISAHGWPLKGRGGIQFGSLESVSIAS